MFIEVLQKIKDVRKQNYRPVRIEVGERQARALADEFNATIPTPDPILMAASDSDYEPPKPITWEDVTQGTARLWGVKLVGVESPDYLNVIGEEPA